MPCIPNLYSIQEGHMDNKINNLFKEMINENFDRGVISNSINKDQLSKIKLRPILLKGEWFYQASEFRGEKVFHSNYSKEQLLEKLPEWFDGQFRQAELWAKESQATILISKKGKTTVKVQRTVSKDAMKNPFSNSVNNDNRDTELECSLEGSSGPIDMVKYSHNKKKNYILKEGEALPFLVDLGVMTSDGRIVKAKFDKYRQINRFLEYIEDILPYLDKKKELTILDFGCGKSYLTFAMYYYLKLQKGYRINVIGLDLKADVISHCNKLSKKYNYDKLQFLQGDIASYQSVDAVDMVVTLHACDTATDYALYKAVTWGAEVILSVPCCQHEINKQIHNDLLQPILKYGIIKERISALITDAFRAELLETVGYRVQLLEFIDMEHTPKNILIRAVKRKTNSTKGADMEQKLKAAMEFLGISPSLERLLDDAKLGEGK